jgi:hypothetical protein
LWSLGGSRCAGCLIFNSVIELSGIWVWNYRNKVILNHSSHILAKSSKENLVCETCGAYLYIHLQKHSSYCYLNQCLQERLSHCYSCYLIRFDNVSQAFLFNILWHDDKASMKQRHYKQL